MLNQWKQIKSSYKIKDKQFMDKEFHHLMRDRGEVITRYDVQTKAIWLYWNPYIRPCYSLNLLKEHKELLLDIIEYVNKNDMKVKTPIHYFVNASQVPGIFNYGGDLNTFLTLIKAKDADQLFQYAKTCIDIVYLQYVNLKLPLTTISLVEGTALGGGFEAVLSCNVSIVEEHCTMGLPEIKFNLFPGMGAYSFLARSVGSKIAEEIITNGNMYSAKELYEMGVITQFVKKGEAEKAVKKFIKQHSRKFNGIQAIQKVKHRYDPLDYDELLDITKIWVDTALNLEKKDLKMMKKLVDAQNKKIIDMQYKLRTKQDRRFDKIEFDFPFEDSNGNIISKERRDNIDPRILKDT